jgi:sugar/nucleoside kinase (ribokinase family)
VTEAPIIDVLVLGELNPDLLLSGPGITPRFGQVETLVDHAGLALGSSGAIFAVGAAKLGLRTTMAGLVGDDTFGDFVTLQLRKHGVGIEGIVADATVTTGLTVILNRGEDRAILTHLGAMAQMTASRVDTRLLARARHLHVTSYFLQRSLQRGLPELLQLAKDNGTTTSLDTNWDPAERWDDAVHDVLRLVDTFLPNEAEAMAITGTDTPQAAAEALSRIVPCVVIKRGALGAQARCDGQEFAAHPPRVVVCDTTGAGDSFDAGYIYGLLRDLPIAERLRAACLCGAWSTQGVGGVAAQLTEAQLRSSMAGTSL